jgi:hypothetical protein
MSLPPAHVAFPLGLEADLPWEDPAQSRLPALLRTVWAFLRRPGPSFRAMHPGGVGPALGFGILTGTFGMAAALYGQLLMSVALDLPLLRWTGSEFSWPVLFTLLLCLPLLVLMGLVLGSFSLHLVTWPWRRPGLGAAFRVTGYAQAGLVTGLVPVVGGMLALSLSLYLRVRGVQEVFRLPGWRAWLAVAGALLLESLFLVAGGLVLLVPLAYLALL